MKTYDVAVIGGGLLGSAFAYGLALRGARVAMLDEGDHAIRTARGNFGLVWIQGKGLGMRPYARWSLEASRCWPQFSDQLLDATGISTAYQRPGGFDLELEESDLQVRVACMEQLRREAGDEGYDYEVLDQSALRAVLPDIGERVSGATYCPHDGHCNPLRLLRALHAAYLVHGGQYLPRCHVDAIEVLPGGGFTIQSGKRQWQAQKVVIAAGHGASELSRQFGIELPVHPDQGQVLVTERCAPRLAYPTNYVRQTDDGTYLLSPSSRDVGYDLDTDVTTLRDIAARCTRAFPFLRHLRIQRSWAALRVMTPDGCPAYDLSSMAPGIFSFACHSGVTLASVHALVVPDWILAGKIPDDYQVFSASRFNVPA